MAIELVSGSTTSSIKVGGSNAISIEESTRKVSLPVAATFPGTRVDGALVVNGKAAYNCRAWVNFDGGAVTNSIVGVRGCANIAAVLDLGVGHYKVYFLEPMDTASAYVVTASLQYTFSSYGSWMVRALSNQYFQVANYSNGRLADGFICMFAVIGN